MAVHDYSYQIRELKLADGEQWYAIYEKSLSWQTLFPKYELRTVAGHYDLFPTIEAAQEKKQWLERRRDGNPIISERIIK